MLRFRVFEDEAGEWRWDALSGSRIVADSGEGYSRRRRCVSALNRFCTLISDGEYQIEVES